MSASRFLPQAGTLSGNPLAMTAGIKTLEILRRDNYAGYEHMDKLTTRLINGILDAGKVERGLGIWNHRGGGAAREGDGGGLTERESAGRGRRFLPSSPA